MGDPVKAAKVMVKLAENPTPPVHLVLGSEAVHLIKQAEASRREEMDKWMDVSASTNADDAIDITQTELGKSFFAAKK
jgi:hypothetical protein